MNGNFVTSSIGTLSWQVTVNADGSVQWDVSTLPGGGGDSKNLTLSADNITLSSLSEIVINASTQLNLSSNYIGFFGTAPVARPSVEAAGSDSLKLSQIAAALSQLGLIALV